MFHTLIWGCMTDRNSFHMLKVSTALNAFDNGSESDLRVFLKFPSLPEIHVTIDEIHAAISDVDIRSRNFSSRMTWSKPSCRTVVLINLHKRLYNHNLVFLRPQRLYKVRPLLLDLLQRKREFTKVAVAILSWSSAWR